MAEKAHKNKEVARLLRIRNETNGGAMSEDKTDKTYSKRVEEALRILSIITHSGLNLVPQEATEEMCVAGAKAASISAHQAERAWQAMLIEAGRSPASDDALLLRLLATDKLATDKMN